MSPYSSLFRGSIWGGIPIALPAMAVFAFLGFWSLWMALNDRDREPRSTGFLALGSVVPVLASLIMGYLSLVELEATCKLCIGIYASSALLFFASLALWLSAHRTQEAPRETRDSLSSPQRVAPLSFFTLGLAFATGFFSVAITVGAYAASAPDFSSYVGSCGTLAPNTIRESVLVDFGAQTGRSLMLEVLDPLCPSCRAFEDRFTKMEAAQRVDRKMLLFPLEDTCNWMIDRSIHPGACSVSEAILCSKKPEEVINWAFEHQQEIMTATQNNPEAAANMAKSRFPDLTACIGSAAVEARLNQALRQAVKSRLQVLTPQVFVQGVRLCGEDTDLGLDFALPRLIEMSRSRAFALDASKDEPTAAPVARPPTHRRAASNIEDASPPEDRRKALADRMLEEAKAGEKTEAEPGTFHDGAPSADTTTDLQHGVFPEREAKSNGAQEPEETGAMVGPKPDTEPDAEPQTPPPAAGDGDSK